MGTELKPGLRITYEALESCLDRLDRNPEEKVKVVLQYLAGEPTITEPYQLSTVLKPLNYEQSQAACRRLELNKIIRDTAKLSQTLKSLDEAQSQAVCEACSEQFKQVEPPITIDRQFLQCTLLASRYQHWERVDSTLTRGKVFEEKQPSTSAPHKNSPQNREIVDSTLATGKVFGETQPSTSAPHKCSPKNRLTFEEQLKQVISKDPELQTLFKTSEPYLHQWITETTPRLSYDDARRVHHSYFKSLLQEMATLGEKNQRIKDLRTSLEREVTQYFEYYYNNSLSRENFANECKRLITEARSDFKKETSLLLLLGKWLLVLASLGTVLLASRVKSQIQTGKSKIRFFETPIDQVCEKFEETTSILQTRAFGR